MGFGSFLSKAASFIPVVGPAISAGIDLVGGDTIDSVASTAMDIGKGVYMSDRANAASRENSAMSYKLSREAYKERYQDTVADLKKAGLNPILAAGGGFNVGQSVTAPMAQSFQGDTGNPYASTALQVSQKRTEKSKAELNYAKAKQSLEDVNTQLIRQGLMTEQMSLTYNQAALAGRQFDKIEKEMDLIDRQTKLTEAEKRKVEKVIAQYKANLEKLRKLSKVYSGPAGQIIAYLEAIASALNIGGAFVKSFK